MSKEKKVTIGNFILKEKIIDGVRYVELKAVAETWSISWREDNDMFAKMMLIMDDDNDIIKEYLHRLCASYYIHTNYLHDFLCMANGGIRENDESARNYLPFLTAHSDLFHSEAERDSAILNNNTEKEQKEALEEVGNIEDIYEAAENAGVDIIKELEKEEQDD